MRVACLDLPAFPLQLVWRATPAWRANPVVVIERDRPHGEVLWACEHARAAGVLPGQRYSHALALCPGLRARVVPEAQIAEAVLELRGALAALSPGVEPDGTGTFWLDGGGLERLFPGRDPARAWGDAIARAAFALGYRGAVVVGFSRFATYAIARVTRGVAVSASDAEERARASEVPLARLEVDPALREALGRLGVTRVGALVRLPAGGILERFGRDAHRLYQLAAGERWDPLVPVAPPEAPDERVLFDDDETNLESLLFASRPAVERLIGRLAARAHALTALHVELTLKHAVGDVSVRADCIKPAQPTLDSRALLRLLHLRLTGAPPEAPVNAVRVWAEEIAASHEQLALFARLHRPRRELRAADEALARLRAELGDQAVCRVELRDSHVPEASYGWQPLVHLAAPAPGAPAIGVLVRRVLATPAPIASRRANSRDDGWLLSGLEHGAVTRITGPYPLVQRWWGEPIHRDYHYAELKQGDAMWLYYDRHRCHWYWQGKVE
jgi:protein ImuB